jgi:hypothetical protein
MAEDTENFVKRLHHEVTFLIVKAPVRTGDKASIFAGDRAS